MFTCFGRELEVGIGREIEELGFYSTRFLTVSIMFSRIILVRRRLGSLEEGTSQEAINLLITLEKA